MSILDNEEDLINSNNELIHVFLKENYQIDGPYTIKNDVVDVKGDVIVKNKLIKSLTDDLFSFGIVVGDFNCSYCRSLQSLEGAPKEVGSNFYCFNCESLQSLEGAPKEVSGVFDCYSCKSLKTLKGAPKKVGRHFDCSWCGWLTTLEGAPEKIGEYFNYSYCRSLKNINIS